MLSPRSSGWTVPPQRRNEARMTDTNPRASGPRQDRIPSLMPTAYRVIPPGDGEIIERVIDWPRSPGYDAIRALITPLLYGADLEHVTVLHDDNRTDMFVDEIGKIKQLQRNDRATVIYRTNWLTQHPTADPESLPAIYGPAVLFLRRIWY